MKKILFVSTLANASKFSLPFMKWFQDNDWEVHYASCAEETIPYCDKSHTIAFSRSPFSINNFFAYRTLKKIINKEKFSIIHCHNPIVSAMTRLAAKKTRKKGTTIIYTCHGFHFYKGAPLKNWLLFYPIEKLLASLTDTLICINSEDLNIATNKKFKARHIDYVPGVGVDLKKFSLANLEERNTLRKKYGFLEAEFILIYVAELNTNKNHQMLINELPTLKKSIENLKVLFVGVGPEKEKLESLVNTVNANGYVQFLGYRRDVDKLYKLSDVCVATSIREGMPLNIVEAMASGLAIVASDNRGHREIMQAQRNEYLISLDDSPKMAEKILSLYYDKNLRRKFRTENPQIVEKFDITKVMPIMINIYKRYI